MFNGQTPKRTNNLKKKKKNTKKHQKVVYVLYS